jgi:hypothetical protein
MSKVHACSQVPRLLQACTTWHLDPGNPAASQSLTASRGTACSQTSAHQGDDKYLSRSELSRLMQATRALRGPQRQLTTRAAVAISAAAGMRISDVVHMRLHEMHVSPECEASTQTLSPWHAETPLLVFGNTQAGQGQHRWAHAASLAYTVGCMPRDCAGWQQRNASTCHC